MKALSPAHITGFFKIYLNGSTGAGINLENGMQTKVKTKKALKNSIKINLNKKKCFCETSLTVAKKMLSLTEKKFDLTVNHFTKFPVGYGLGLSGAGALSLALALNKELKLKLNKKKCIEIAKNAEIKNKTGLGDVIAEQFSGTMIGAKPYPSTKIISIKSNYNYIVLGFFKPIKTKKIISSNKWKKKINKFGSIAMQELMEEKSFQNLVLQSRNFTFRTKLFSKPLLKALEFFPFSSMSMLGQTIFIPSHNPKKTEKKLKKFTSNTLIAKIAEKGAK
jgi:pantoate kinase